MNRTYFLLFFIFISFSVFSQNEEQVYLNSISSKSSCATQDLLYDNERDFKTENSTELNRNLGYTQWPMRIHIVTQNDGTGGISMDDINKGLANINYVYAEMDLEWFIVDTNYIASDLYYNFVDSSTYQEDILDAHLVPDAVNVFFFNSIEIPSFGFACGYAYFPFDSELSLTIFMDNDCTATSANGTFAHELGHHLNLAHTHSGTSQGNNSGNAEHVPRTGANSNCSTHGDFLCDTDADPDGSSSNCIYNGGGTDIFGNLYTPPIDNIMSYYPDFCGGILTPEQYNRCANAVVTRLNHTSYDIDGAVPNDVVDPSGLTATINGIVSIDLSWTDNASNELGYLIERSTDGGDFTAMELAGVGPNITTYSDSDIQGNTTYCYRIKASNDNPDHYSNTICETAPNVICGSEVNLLFNNNELIQTPFDISGLPTSLPSCQTELIVNVLLVGDFGDSFEAVDIIGEDNVTILATSGTSNVDCNINGANATFTLDINQYNSWAADGTINFTVDANSGVNDFCSVNTVISCTELLTCVTCTDGIQNGDEVGVDCGGATCPPCCMMNLSVNDVPIPDDTYHAENLLDSQGEVNPNSNVIFKAGTNILLLDGFKASNYFKATIEACPQ